MSDDREAPRRRTFPDRASHRGYLLPPQAQVDHDLYGKLSQSGWEHITKKLTVPKKSDLAWEVKAGQTCRVVCAYGPQVGDVNLWSLENPKRERFYSGKTRQIHRSHLSTYDRMWSCHPYLRPLATVTRDTLEDYGIDKDGCSMHDVTGTRCDPYIQKLITGEDVTITCHQNLTNAITPWGLSEDDVHDVFNIFMCSGFDYVTHEYVIKGSPVQKGDFIEWLAEVDLLVALSACPCGDVAHPAGEPVPEDKCYPLDVYVGQPDQKLLELWGKDRQ